MNLMIPFGLADLTAGIIFYLSDFKLPALITLFISGFMIFKGITTLTNIPVWIGPIAFFAGFIDIAGGAILYTGSTFLAKLGLVFGVILILKGLFTVMMPIGAG